MRSLPHTVTKLLLALLAILSLSVFFQYGLLSFDKERSRNAVNTLFQSIKQGDSKKDVALEIIKSSPRGFYAFFTNDDRLYISAPREFFQGHWILMICFSEGIVSGKRIGTGDNIEITPKGASMSVGPCQFRKHPAND